MIGNFLQLQYKLANRWLKDSGIHPFAAYCIAAVIFVFLSLRLFNETEFAVYIYIIIAIAVMTLFSERRRNEFLKTCFKKSKYRQIRVVENLLAIVPFIIILLFKHNFMASTILIVAGVALSFLDRAVTLNFTLPTPFYKRPFEFTVGFRRNFYFIGLLYGLAVIATVVGNYNLGVFSVVLLFLVIAGFYSRLENEYYIWLYNVHPAGFLAGKIRTAILYATGIMLPVVLWLSAFFFDNIIYLLLIALGGYALLACVVIAKYASYPEELNVIHGILIVISIIFPPLLPVLILYFYKRSLKKLKFLLG